MDARRRICGVKCIVLQKKKKRSVFWNLILNFGMLIWSCFFRVSRSDLESLTVPIQVELTRQIAIILANTKPPK
jgi:hypothetical protein